MKTSLALMSAVALVVLTGCGTVGTDYKAPSAQSLSLPTAWHTATPSSAEAQSFSVNTLRQQRWWTELGDSTLDTLVDASWQASPTLDAALARLSEARASERQTLSSGFPSIAGSSNRQRGQQTAAGISTNTNAALNASWELDLFGAVSRGIEGAQARVQAKEADVADAHVSLAADVADAYSSLRQCQVALTLSEADLVSRESTAQLTSLKADAGFVAPYLAARALATVAEGRTALESLKSQCERTVHLLSRLTGLSHERLNALLTPTSDVPKPTSVSVALPEAVLRLRPDLVIAERTLAAASADIGLAQANRYPRLSLSGNWGYSAQQSGVGAVSLGVWSLGPSLTLPLFDGGSRQAAVDSAQARYDQALAAYRQKIGVAMQEIEDGLTRYATATRRQATATLAVRNYQVSFQAIDARYREGAASLLELEDARRALLNAQQTDSAVQLEKTQAWVALHRATGGGWQPDFTSAAPSAGPSSAPAAH